MNLNKKQTPEGLKSVIEMLRVMEIEDREKLLANIAKENIAFADLLRQQIFTFQDLCNLSPREIQTLLRGVSEDKLSLALRGEDEGIIAVFLKNMPSKLGESVKELIESGPARKKSDVIEAQNEILQFAKGLDREGKINLRKEANEEWVE